MHTRSISAFLVAAAAIATPASAGFTIYTDRTLFEAALGSVQVVDFNGFTGQPASFDGTTLDVGPFSLTGDSTGPFSDMRIAGERAEANVCGAGQCGFSFGYSFAFDAPTFGFGADYTNVFGGSGLTFTVLGSSFAGPVVNNGFFGFISTDAFTGIAVSGNDEIHQFDNVTFGGTAVPEPASWAMLIAGFGLAGAAMRRRRALLAA